MREPLPDLARLSVALTRVGLTTRISLIDAMSHARKATQRLQLYDYPRSEGARITQEIDADAVEASLLRRAREQVRQGRYRWLDPDEPDTG